MPKRVTYANVVATLALFVALGGGAYAAMTVTGKHVKNRSLSGKDIRPESITGKHVKGLTADDFRGGRVLKGSSSVVRVTGTVDSDGVGTDVASCGGDTVTGGGFGAGNTDGRILVSEPAGNGWIVYLDQAQPGAEFQVYAICSP